MLEAVKNPNVGAALGEDGVEKGPGFGNDEASRRNQDIVGVTVPGDHEHQVV